MKIHLPVISALFLAGSLPAAHAGLAGWWPLDGTFTDDGGVNDGTELGVPVFEADIRAGLTGQSLRFTADSDAVTIPADVVLDSDIFTLGYFINQSGATQGNAGLERLTSRGGDSFETAIGDAHALGSPPDGNSQLSYYSSASAWQRTGVQIPATGWVHVAWHNTSTSMQLYVDGVLAFTGPRVGTPNGGMSIGARLNTGPMEGFEGLMDDVFLWNDAVAPLTPANIKTIAGTGIAPFLGDTDGDGLPDLWEQQYNFDKQDNGANPNNNGVAGNPVNGPAGDPDTDALTNIQELEHGTDPRDDDSDDDGLKDGAEITLGTDPKNPDTDHDGLNDKAEGTAGSDPLLPDTDGDGFLDSLEVAKGSSPKDINSMPAPADTLVAHLNFNDTAADQSGFGNNGTLINEPVYSADIPAALTSGRSLTLANGGGVENQGVNIPASAFLNSRLFTLAYWIKPTSAQESAAGLERLTSRTGYGFETAIGSASGAGGTSSPSGLTLSYYDGNWHVTHVEIIQDEWVHVAWVSSDAEMNLYLNGVLAYTGSPVSATAPGQGLMRIGTSFQSNEGFEGNMDDFRLYAAPLSAEDIVRISGSSVPPAGSFDFTAFSRTSDGASVSLTWSSQANRTYALDYSTDLKLWLGVSGAIPSGGTTTTFVDTVFPPLNRSRLYYRVRRN
ncbi:MAG: LamG-like jellyroll fold domain-containing protein [Verrucomicrobiota bacterium]